MHNQQKSVLITGVTGFAGSCLADYLLNRGYRDKWSVWAFCFLTLCPGRFQ
ncbi:MAG: NAD-dependent epimerase/dehydratase family protein [Candidatus Riflebacteria bacterium]